MSWEDTLTAWAKGPSETETDKCNNAERAIKEALRADRFLERLPTKPRVFVQGSYRANTNVRQDSDVDICILLPDTYIYDLQFSDIQDKDEPGKPGSITYADFRNAVESALVSHFERRNVTRGNKAFDVHSNSYRVDADVVAAFEYHRYRNRQPDGSLPYDEGIIFFPDAGGQVVNYPEQTHQNGIEKNNTTGRVYKRAIRILKRTRNAMQDAGISAANDIGSFLIESLVWNVPDDYFAEDTYRNVMQNVLAHTFNATLKDEDCAEWGEVNELKYIFKGNAPLRKKVHAFLSAAWDYLDYK